MKLVAKLVGGRVISIVMSLKKTEQSAMDLANNNQTSNPRITLENCAGKDKVALIFHLKISDVEAYKIWLNNSKNKLGGKRLFRVKTDPAPREGMDIDEVVIDEHLSSKCALEFMSSFGNELKSSCSSITVLAITPDSPATFYLIKAISWLVQLFKGIKDSGVPTAHWKAENTAVWPDEFQMQVARNQNLDDPIFVYNLNKNKKMAYYKKTKDNSIKISGQEAYDRYAKIAGFELLRRGAFPVYGGTPICLLEYDSGCMLADRWDKFIFVRYPQRRNLLATIESPEFTRGEKHRDAGLERVAIFMASET